MVWQGTTEGNLLWWLGDPSGGLEKVADSLQEDTEAVTCLPLPAGLGALPACGSRVVLVHMQPTLERVEGLPGGLPADSTAMGGFCACDSHRLVSKIFALLVITTSRGPPAVTQNYSSHTAQSSPHRALATVLPAVGSCPPSLLQDLEARRGLTRIWCWDLQPLFDV